jgi:hypothetical protein
VLALPASGVSNVTFSLQGYQPQTIAVNVTSVRESLDLPDTGMAEQIRIDPNPVFAALEPTPPPAPPARKRAPAKPKPKPQPAAAAAPPPPPQQQPVQQGWGPPQQQQPGFR